MNFRDTEGDGQTAGYCTLCVWNTIAPYVFVYLYVLFCDACTGTVLQETPYCAVAAVAADDSCIMLHQRNTAGRSQQFNISRNWEVHGSSLGLWNHWTCRYSDRHGNTTDLLNPPHIFPLKHLQFTEHTFTDTVNITKLCKHMVGITDSYAECFGFRFRPLPDNVVVGFSSHCGYTAVQCLNPYRTNVENRVSS